MIFTINSDSNSRMIIALANLSFPYVGLQLNPISSIYSKKGQWDLAVAIGEKGLAINSNWANYNVVFAHVLTVVGRNEEAIVLIKKAIRLNPHHPPWYLAILGITYNNLNVSGSKLEL